MSFLNLGSTLNCVGSVVTNFEIYDNKTTIETIEDIYKIIKNTIDKKTTVGIIGFIINAFSIYSILNYCAPV